MERIANRLQTTDYNRSQMGVAGVEGFPTARSSANENLPTNRLPNPDRALAGGKRLTGPQEQTSDETIIRGYDIDIDIADFKNRTENITALKLRKKHDLETMLGERFNVEITNTNYELKNNMLYHSEFQQPFKDRIKMGISYRQEKNSPDLARELAELEGFEKIEQELPHSPNGTKFVVISPPGINYPKNFFDIYEKVAPDKVKASRYTSTLSLKEHLQIAQELDIAWQAAAISNPNSTPTDADFLRAPIRTTLSTESVLKQFHPEEDTMPLQDYESLTEAAAPLIHAILNQLENDPAPEKVYPLYNAILNFADKYHGNPKERGLLAEKLLYGFKNYSQELSELPVRQVMAGCGLQTGYDTANGNAPYSVADYALQDRFGKLDIECGNCGFSYLRLPGQLEEKCRKCGGTKGIAC